VARYIRSFPQTVEFIKRITELLTYLLPHYIREGKSYLTIAFGCTGGQHRSVMMADQIRKNLAEAGFKAEGKSPRYRRGVTFTSWVWDVRCGRRRRGGPR
jgi:RNase adaptor protein for sRNA GlmZ degradation